MISSQTRWLRQTTPGEPVHLKGGRGQTMDRMLEYLPGEWTFHLLMTDEVLHIVAAYMPRRVSLAPNPVAKQSVGSQDCFVDAA